jgi:hypothetical protein
MDELKISHESLAPASSTSRRRALKTMACGTLVAALATRAGDRGRSASARQATPAAGGENPTPGTAVPFKSVEGVEVGKITVTKLTDPFTGYRPNSPPQRGNRFLLLSASVENTGPNPWTFDPGAVFIQDADGFITRPSGIDLGDPPVEPALTYQEIPPATTVSGAIGYTLLQGVQPIRAFFQPAGDRLILLADLR